MGLVAAVSAVVVVACFIVFYVYTNKHDICLWKSIFLPIIYMYEYLCFKDFFFTLSFILRRNYLELSTCMYVCMSCMS